MQVIIHYQLDIVSLPLVDNYTYKSIMISGYRFKCSFKYFDKYFRKLTYGIIL